MEQERTKYLVHKANIMDDDGNKVLAGSVVALSPKLARHYNSLGFLRPFMDDEEEEEPDDDEEEDDDEPSIPARPRRTSTITGSAQVPPGPVTKPV